jgi:hypothetical protein
VKPASTALTDAIRVAVRDRAEPDPLKRTGGELVNYERVINAARDDERAVVLDALKSAEDWARGELAGVLAAPPRRYAESILAAFARLRTPRAL